MTFIWATRGRSWGFRFLRSGGFRDPLPIYEAVFDAVDFGAEGYQSLGGRAALRIADPEGRADRSGRPITHDFVLLGTTAREVHSIGDGIDVVWPQVEAEYAALWDATPPRV